MSDEVVPYNNNATKERSRCPPFSIEIATYPRFLLVSTVTEAHGYGHGSTKGGDQNTLEDSARSGPYFDKSASKNVTALLGKTTYLNCRVKNLGNRTVSDALYPHTHIHSHEERGRKKSVVNNLYFMQTPHFFFLLYQLTPIKSLPYIYRYSLHFLKSEKRQYFRSS